jgi:cell division protease FtsH
VAHVPAIARCEFRGRFANSEQCHTAHRGLVHLFQTTGHPGNVATISSRGDTIQGHFRQQVPYTPEGGDSVKQVRDFSTVRPAFADPGLEALLDAQGVVVNATPIDEPANPLLNLILGFGPTLLLIAGFIWISSRASGAMSGGGLFGIGRSQAKRYDEGAGTLA